MAAFSELDWARFDAWALLAMEGIAVVRPAHRESGLIWLLKHGYSVDSIDFQQGIGPAVLAMGKLFNWEEQFGYSLKADSRNINALRDGFEFHLAPGQGKALELLSVEFAFFEDDDWLFGLLSIAHEHSRWQLALGTRFFVILYLDEGSELIGKQYESLSVAGPYWSPAQGAAPFADVTNGRNS
jgi:hypothetical protein